MANKWDSSVIVSEARGTELYPTQIEPHNLELHNAVGDSAIALTALFGECKEWLAGHHKRWDSAVKHHSQSVRNFEEEMAHPYRIGYDDVMLTKDFNLKLSTEWLAEFGTIHLPQVALTVPVFDELFAQPLRLKRREEVTAEMGPVVDQLYPLDNCAIVETLLKMNGFQHTDALAILKSEFAKTLQVLLKLEAELARTLEDRDQALRTEDVATAEEKASAALTLMEKILHVAYERNGKVEHGSGDVEAFLQNTEEFYSQRQYERGVDQKLNLKTTVLEDIEQLRTEGERETQRAVEERDAFVGRTKELKKRLDENGVAQDRIWSEIKEKFVAMEELLQQREGIVKQQLKETETEQLRLRRFAEYTAVQQNRAQEMEKLLKNTESALQFGEYVDNYMKKAYERVRLADFRGQLKSIEVEEGNRLYDIYTRFVKFGGELLYRRSQRLENLKRMTRTIEFQVEHAVDSLDTELVQYRDQIVKFKSMEDRISASIENLKTEMADQERRWKEFEDKIDDANDDFVPPDLILQELKKALMADHVKAVDDLTNTEQRLLDNEKSNFRKVNTAFDATKSAVDERKATKKARAAVVSSRPTSRETVSSPGRGL